LLEEGQGEGEAQGGEAIFIVAAMEEERVTVS